MATPFPLVSVLIPVYGVELYIEECLRSVLRQTYTPLEIILVDDASPDQSIELAERVIAQDNRYRHQVHIVRHEKNLGIVGARITALKKAQGELLFFLDSDDYFLSPYAIEKSVECMLREQADMLIFNYTELFKKSQRRSTLPRIYDSKKLVYALLEGTTPAYFWNKVFRRDLFLEKANFFQMGNNMWEDMQNVVLYSLVTQRIVYLEDNFVAYRRTNERSVTLDFSSNNILSMRRVVIFLSEHFKKHYTGNELEYLNEGLNKASSVVDLVVLCSSNYQGMRKALTAYPSLHTYAQEVGGVGGKILRLALLFYRKRMPHIAYALLRLKASLRHLR
ncbi:glycosyltransferase family 2 protein [Porphyromonas gingivicanis]|uniref:glycosyltransferase family 2 protein n=1 Tax=Porphyromonas gingivicanis TaxID=266762 RepID=UPI00047041CC|nr:glycosyltransferase family 2 protein [Porphyromonas gingivicanis]